MKTSQLRPGRAHARGITLIELMVSLLLGLMITGAALAVFSTNRQTYTATESLGRIQENARVAFELMSRDVREGAGNPCDNGLPPPVNVVKNPGTLWYTDFSAGIRGYADDVPFGDAAFGSAAAQRAAGTDAIEIKSAVSNGVTVADHQPVSADFKVNTVDHGMNDGDIVMVCDFGHSAIFQVTNASPGTNPNVVHNTGTGNPGNDTKCLSPSGACSSGTTKTYAFGCKNGESPCPGDEWPATVAKLRMTRWYIGCNARSACDQPGGRSLYQSTIANAGGSLSVQNDEIAEGVRDMALSYLRRGGDTYDTAATVEAAAGWNDVIAVSIDLTLEGNERIGTDGNALERRLQHVVTLRNRAP